MKCRTYWRQVGDSPILDDTCPFLDRVPFRTFLIHFFMLVIHKLSTSKSLLTKCPETSVVRDRFSCNEVTKREHSEWVFTVTYNTSSCHSWGWCVIRNINVRTITSCIMGDLFPWIHDGSWSLSQTPFLNFGVWWL